jgi:hypothetical protein
MGFPTDEVHMTQRLPPAAIALGLAGLLPFIFCGIGALEPQARASTWLLALLGYGAVILSFLGGIHWGFVLRPEPGMTDRGIATRLALGVVPSLIGWVAVVAAVVLPAEVGLAVLIAGFIVTVGGEERLRRETSFPAGYMAFRWTLSLLVVMALTTVLTLRLIGAHISF